MLQKGSTCLTVKTLGRQTNASITALNRPSPTLAFRKEASPCRFKDALSTRMYPSFYPRTKASALYLRSESHTPKAATSPSPESLSFPVENLNGEKFSWFKNWWAVQVVSNLETDRPNKIQLLNRDYIVWKGHSGEWIAMDDECPHRMAPLSEGRIEDDGNLLCSYHAWRFNESGKCVKIPHAEDEKAHSVACNSPRSAVQTYPCKIRGGLLWMWPDASDTAFADSANKPLQIEDDLADFYDNHATHLGLTPFVRILPYSYDTLMEELSDPARMHSAYHGAIPAFNRERAAPINMKKVEPIGDHEVLEAVTFEHLPMAHSVHLELRPPGTFAVWARRKDGKPKVRNCQFVRPVTDGQSMLIMMPTPQRMISHPPIAKFILKPLLTFCTLFFHLKIVNKALDSSAVLLHEQDKRTKQTEAHFSARTEYYVPTTEDTMVMSFRKWFETVGDHGAAFGGDRPLDPELEMAKEALLDRYEQYTKHSKLSLGALGKVRTLIAVFKALFTVSGLLVCGLLFKDFDAGILSVESISKNVTLIVSAVVSVLSLLARKILENKVIPLFYFVDHSYADAN